MATFNNGGPMLTIVWGIWLFDEVLTLTLIVGAVADLGRHVLGQSATPRRERAPA